MHEPRDLFDLDLRLSFTTFESMYVEDCESTVSHVSPKSENRIRIFSSTPVDTSVYGEGRTQKLGKTILEAGSKKVPWVAIVDDILLGKRSSS